MKNPEEQIRAMNAPYRYNRPRRERHGRVPTPAGPGAVLLTAIVLAGCSGASLPQPVPENAQNPIEIHAEDLTPDVMVKATNEAMSAIGIPLLQSDRKRAYVESKWVDVSQYIQARRIAVKAVYRPYGIDVARQHDRLVPTDHPGYQLAMRVARQVRLQLIENNVTVNNG
jgi:hypothetical protein